MNALGNGCGLGSMARGALHFRDVFGMGKFLNVGMTPGTIQDGMDTYLMFARIDVDTVSCVGFQIFIAVAGEAVRVGIRGGLSNGGS